MDLTTETVINEALSGVFNRDRRLREAISSFKAEGTILKITAKAGRGSLGVLTNKMPKLGLFILKTGMPIETIYVFAEDSCKLKEIPMLLLESYLSLLEATKRSEGALDKRLRTEQRHLK